MTIFIRKRWDYKRLSYELGDGCRTSTKKEYEEHVEILDAIGENGHLAFNDPPADFEIETPYIVADLDDACRRQQLGEGWFERLDSVPRQAISMCVHQVMKSRHIVCTVPDRRKAEAVQRAFEGEVSLLTPASILQRHLATTAYLDSDAATVALADSSLSHQQSHQPQHRGHHDHEHEGPQAHPHGVIKDRTQLFVAGRSTDEADADNEWHGVPQIDECEDWQCYCKSVG